MYQVIDSNGTPGEPVDVNVIKQWALEGKVTAGTILLDPITGLTASAGDMLTTYDVFPQSGETPSSAIPPPLHPEESHLSSSVMEQSPESGISSSPPIESGLPGFAATAPAAPVETDLPPTPTPETESIDFSTPPIAGIDFAAPAAPAMESSSQPQPQIETPALSQPLAQPSGETLTPMPPSQPYLATPGVTPVGYPAAAPILNRFVGLLIDGAITIPLYLLAMIPVVNFLVAPVLVAYWLSRDSFMNGQSVGKKVMGERAVRLDGQPFTWKDSALRNITYLAFLVMLIPYLWIVLAPPLLGLVGIAEIICVLTTQKRIGDHLNNTLVISDQG